MTDTNRSLPARAAGDPTARFGAFRRRVRRVVSRPREHGPTLLVAVIALGVVVIGAAILGWGEGLRSPGEQAYSDVENSAAHLAEPETESATGRFAAGAADSSGSGAADDFAATQNAADFGRKVARVATLAVTVERVDQTLVFIRDAAASAGGFVFSSSTFLQDDLTHGQIVVHVPFDRFDALMSQLRQSPGLATIESESTASEDVTSAFVDTESRIRNLQATEQGYLKLLDRAVKVEDMLLVQSHLSEVRGEIEALQGRLNHLDRISAFSTITVTIAPVAAPAPTSTDGNALIRAARESWEASLAIVGTAAIGLMQVVIFSWWLVLPAAAAWVFYLRRRSRAIPSGTAA